jgi:hypothetical protein
MRHFSGLFTSLWKRRYDKRMDLALICLGKDVTPEKLEQKEKDSLHKISFYFLRKVYQIQPDWFLFFPGMGGVYDQTKTSLVTVYLIC